MYSQLSHSEVGPRSSEFKVPQVEQKVVMGAGDPQSAPPVGMVDTEIVLDRLLPIVRTRRPMP